VINGVLDSAHLNDFIGILLNLAFSVFQDGFPLLLVLLNFAEFFPADSEQSGVE